MSSEPDVFHAKFEYFWTGQMLPTTLLIKIFNIYDINFLSAEK